MAGKMDQTPAPVRMNGTLEIMVDRSPINFSCRCPFDSLVWLEIWFYWCRSVLCHSFTRTIYCTKRSSLLTKSPGATHEPINLLFCFFFLRKVEHLGRTAANVRWLGWRSYLLERVCFLRTPFSGFTGKPKAKPKPFGGPSPKQRKAAHCSVRRNTF